jgi:hypothetical protein
VTGRLLTLDEILAGLGHDPADLKPFKPVVLYDPNMHTLTALLEDVSYRAQWCGMFEVLWHLHEDRVVGLRILSPEVFANGADVVKRLTAATSGPPP